jgi:soluble lytic murein transglycosylase-like protein
MKLHEIALTEDQLNEVKLRHALAAAGLAGSMALSGASSHQADQPPPPPAQTQQVQTQQPVVAPPPAPKNDVETLTQAILDKYDIDPRLAERVARAALKYEDDTFPKAEDLLAITGIESSFNPRSVSDLPRDPARGLMQVRPGVWNLSPKALSTIDRQIKVGSTILHSYYEKLQSIPDAVHAYNIGLTNFRHGTNLNPDYVEKFKEERKMYDI